MAGLWDWCTSSGLVTVRNAAGYVAATGQLTADQDARKIPARE